MGNDVNTAEASPFGIIPEDINASNLGMEGDIVTRTAGILNKCMIPTTLMQKMSIEEETNTIEIPLHIMKKVLRRSAS